MPWFGAFNSIGNEISQPTDPAHQKLKIILTFSSVSLYKVGLEAECWVNFTCVEFHDTRLIISRACKSSDIARKVTAEFVWGPDILAETGVELVSVRLVIVLPEPLDSI